MRITYELNGAVRRPLEWVVIPFLDDDAIYGRVSLELVERGLVIHGTIKQTWYNVSDEV